MILAAVALAACAAYLAARSSPPDARLLAVRRARPAVPGAGSQLTSRDRTRSAMRAALLAAITAAALGGGLFMATAAAIAAACAPVAIVRRRTARRLAAAGAAIPDACRVLAAQLAAGALPGHALAAAAARRPEPLAQVLRTAATEQFLGASGAAALMAAPAGLEPLKSLAVCWEVCLETGGRVGPTVERLAVVFSSDLEARAAVDSELAGVRLSALVMACLPVFGLALGAALGADPAGFLTTSAAGRFALTVAVVLDAIGLFWVRRLGARAAR